MTDTQKTVGSQIELVRLSMKSKISRALKAILLDVPGVRYVSFDKIRLLAHDFNDLETPAVQLIDIGTLIEHENVRVKKSWRITLELVMKETEHKGISQEDLWDFEYKLERALWKNPNLSIPGVVQLTYSDNSTDLHLLNPYYLMKMNFDVVYYEHLVRDC